MARTPSPPQESIQASNDARDRNAPPRKRKASASVSPQPKGHHKEKEQKTIDETLPDHQMQHAAEQAESTTNEKSTGDNATNHETSAVDPSSQTDQDAVSDSKPGAGHDGQGTVQISQDRKEAMPSNIMEKGIIYFFARGRVGVDQPEGVQDIARSYIVLRPLPSGAKLNEGAVEDLKNNRLLALPKKVLPKSHRDTFMTFVEKAGCTIQELKDDFMKGSEYSTKTTGVRSTPPVTPIGEGVYALTTTGADSHLAYMLTIPSDIGEVQEEMGLKKQGSFHLSAKNPTRPGPASATLPEGPQFPTE